VAYFVGKNTSIGNGEQLQVAGGIGLLACFILLFISYGFYVAIRIRRAR
jgi:hypothetical protein